MRNTPTSKSGRTERVAIAIVVAFGLVIGALVACSIRADAQQAFPYSGPSTDIGGTVTTGGTYQTVAASSTNRHSCTIQNPSTASEPLNVKFASQVQPYVLGPGQSVTTNNGIVNANDTITVTATTTGHAFAGTCQ